MLQLEAYLGQSEVLRLVEENLGAGVWRCDPAGQMQWSRGFFGLLGLDPHVIVPSFAEIQRRIHPDDRRSSRDPSEMMTDRSPLDGEFRIIRPNGALRWLHSRTEVLLDSAGEPECILGVALDITAQRRLLQTVRIDAERYSALAQVADGLLWIGSSDGRITALPNGEKRPEAQRLFGKAWVDLLHEEEREAALSSWAASVETARPYSVEHRLRQPDDTYRWHRCTAVPVTNGDGSIREWMGISVDVHHEKLSVQHATTSRLTGAQLRAARGILNWSVKQLAARTGISAAIIRRLEEYNDAPLMPHGAMEILHRVFSDAGVEFLFPLVGKPGVRPR
ncbi:PAS domain-containing protein [Bradyrhizobium sp. WSM2793]|uniref:PAS domain-containing protein n=1 Tax=Bradyrhizobium sp. WSM2793 TaxID=1038866 RepID=UPI00035DD9EC|nr:PAS domain-containing protein [Bradyrhizobium sp. WSM2793]